MLCPPTVATTNDHRRKLLLGPGAQALPHFYDHGARLYDEPPPHFCDVILSKLCFSCLHWFYAMLINRQLDHSFPAVVDILRKGLNLQAPLDIQWPKCFQLQGGFAPWPPDQGLCPWTPVIGSCSALAMVPPTPSAAYDPRASSPPHLFWQVYAYALYRYCLPLLLKLTCFTKPTWACFHQNYCLHGLGGAQIDFHSLFIGLKKPYYVSFLIGLGLPSKTESAIYCTDLWQSE